MSTAFEPGAPPGGEVIPLCVPALGGREWTYIKECLDTNWVSSVGAFVERFEREVAARVGAPHAVAVGNGTSALHLSLLAAGVGPEDEVLVSSLSFIAPANAIRYVGAWPVFVDAEPRSWQMDAGQAVEFLEKGCRWADGKLTNRATGRRVRAILPVHVLGHPVDMDPLLEAARRYGLAVIEDATESLGAAYKGRPTGAMGDYGCFSFNGNKIITTGGGGMIVTGHEAGARRARYLSTQAKDDPLEYIHGTIGYNYRLTNLQAAMGCAQLEMLDHHVARKRAIAARYMEGFGDLPGLTPMKEGPEAQSCWWLYTVLVDPARCALDSRALIRALRDAKIQSRPLWQPLHRSPAHAGAYSLPCPTAEDLNRRAVSLPSSVSLLEEQQDRVISAVRAACQGGTR